ncbi:MAG: B12-binding domain-containing radical SAM protein [Alphaproteobacteria bacterium]|nr:B12-binding domain-containing radical SAM protein [Alphaproteobacteria bacterium]
MRLLTLVPPYRHRHCPPAGAAALLGQARIDGHADLELLDLRPLTPDVLAPTFNPVGTFGESFVMDIPDLPLALGVLAAFRDGGPLAEGTPEPLFERYALERGIHPRWLRGWLADMEAFLEDVWRGLPALSLVGLSVWSSNLTTSLMAAAMLKRRPAPPLIVAGGPQVSESRASALLGLRAGLFDAVVVGEGERAFCEILRRHRAGEALEGIPGVRTAACPALPEASAPLIKLAEVALPDFSRMDLAAYRAPSGQLRLPYQLSRGCTDRCTFCSEWVFWQRFRPASVERSLVQLEVLSARWGVRAFHFTDSLLNGHPRQLRAFAEGLLERDLQLDWGGFMRAQMDPETARLLRAAGCSYAYIGVESLSDETLAAMNKRRTRAQNLEAIDALLEAGIAVSVGVIPGFPGDTRARFLATARELAALAEAWPGRFSFNVEPFVVSPAQPLARDLDAVGLRPVPWPPEILDITPELADLLEGVACAVEGANQGAERAGQLQVLEVLTDATRGAAASHRPEDLPEDRARFLSAGSLRLALVKQRGRLVGALLRPEEEARLRALVQEGRPGAPLGQHPGFASTWRVLLEQQAWRPGRRAWPARQVERVEDRHRLWVPDHVVGRVERGRLVLAHLLNGRSASLPAALATPLAALSEAAGAAPALRGWLPQRELDDLHRQGFLQVLPPSA